MQTEMLRDLRMRPRAAVVMPLPTELTTPPVTKMNFGMLSVGPGAGQNKWRHLRECRPPRILQGAQKADKQPGRGELIAGTVRSACRARGPAAAGAPCRRKSRPERERGLRSGCSDARPRARTVRRTA